MLRRIPTLEVGWGGGGIKTAPKTEEGPDSAAGKAAPLTAVLPFPPGLPWLKSKLGTNGPYGGIYVVIPASGHVERREAALKTWLSALEVRCVFNFYTSTVV